MYLLSATFLQNILEAASERYLHASTTSVREKNSLSVNLVEGLEAYYIGLIPLNLIKTPTVNYPSVNMKLICVLQNQGNGSLCDPSYPLSADQVFCCITVVTKNMVEPHEHNPLHVLDLNIHTVL